MKISLVAVSLFLISLVSTTAFAAGGAVVLRTDGGADGYYYGLGGSGSDRYISEYPVGTIPPGSIICGARVRERNQGQPPGVMGCELRLEDPANPGYPDLSVPALASADAGSLGPCSNSGVPRAFTFANGAGLAAPPGTHYVCAVEPVHGSGSLDFCGVLLDTSGPYLGFAKYFSGGVFGAIPWNHFVEEVTFTSARMVVARRA